MLYDHVFLIGVDGAGNFFKDADTPNLDYIRAHSSYAETFDAQTAFPTISAECWGAMLLGVTPEMHGYNNGYISQEEHKRTGDVKYPSVFKLAREKYPQARLVSYSDWNPINIGIVEDDIGVEKETGSIIDITRYIINSIESEEAPKLMFVQYDSVDGAGHHFGYGNKQYYNSISQIDAHLGIIWNTLRCKGLLSSTLLIITADHGGTPGGSHGGDTPAERTIYCGVFGDEIKGGPIGKMDVWDIPPIIGKALNLSSSPEWVGKIPENIF
ncbi:MAG: alkaline phosphatase family protein [Clostridiales bacterium]|nr:alkaline phosphatase family protein [Clostridiales bacterium]